MINISNYQAWVNDLYDHGAPYMCYKSLQEAVYKLEQYDKALDKACKKLTWYENIYGTCVDESTDDEWRNWCLEDTDERE